MCAIGEIGNAKAAELVKQARDAAFSPVVNAQKAADKEFLALFAANKKDSAVSKSVTGLENYWNNSARQNYERAKALAEQALVATQ